MVGNDKYVSEFGKRYLLWLMQNLHAEGYSRLFELLHNVRFEWTEDVPMDANLEDHGRSLRSIFEMESGMAIPLGGEDWPASFLEVAASLAFIMEEEIMYHPNAETNVSTWFWHILTNMGIGHCSDVWMADRLDAEKYILDRVYYVMDRQYDPNGFGGFFPLSMPREDQRKVELWYQMNSYILEKGWV